MPNVTQDHKKAMADGRRQSTAIRAYIEALESEAANRRRGRRRTPDSIRNRLTTLGDELNNGDDPLKRIQLIQEQMDLEGELERMENAKDPDDFKKGFIDAVKPYSERKGISYGAWRKLGVPAAVLREAGVSRSS